MYFISFDSSFAWFSVPLICMGDLTAKCKQNLRNTKTEYVQSNSISTT